MHKYACVEEYDAGNAEALVLNGYRFRAIAAKFADWNPIFKSLACHAGGLVLLALTTCKRLKPVDRVRDAQSMNLQTGSRYSLTFQYFLLTPSNSVSKFGTSISCHSTSKAASRRSISATC